MAKNAFTQIKEFVDKPKRNTFDLSFQNNLTMRFGKLYPVFCKEVIPGDSFQITPSFGLRYMPMVFPVQTRMQANLHFFYVRNRNLWKDWTDFIGRTKSNLVPPYLSAEVAKQVAKTCGLGDYLGLPTTLVGDYGRYIDDSTEEVTFKTLGGVHINYACGPNAESSPGNFTRTLHSIEENSQYWYNRPEEAPSAPACSYAGVISRPFDISNFAFDYEDSSKYPYFEFTWPIQVSALSASKSVIFELYYPYNDTWKVCGYNSFTIDSSSPVFTSVQDFVDAAYNDDILYGFVTMRVGDRSITRLYINPGMFTFECTDGNEYSLMDVGTFMSDTLGTSNCRISLVSNSVTYDSNQFNFNLFAGCGIEVGDSSQKLGQSVYSFVIPLKNVSNGDISEAESLNPYAQGDLKISALPFRAYESIYNAFYRNQFNDPFILDGQKEFNRYITNNEGGEDSTPYELFNRNWEMDFLTSAKQSPVDGDITPLVGVNSVGDFTFKNSDDSTYTVTPIIGEDGHTLTGIQSVEGTPENNSGIRRLTDMISIGISINDFRNVNALQRWLETNLRRGYRYKDQLMSHFGVDARYDELDMPEFIGGMSEPVLVNQVNQSVDNTGNDSGLGDFSKVLGSYAGQASVFAQSRHDITHYFDEHGFVIGIFSITPVPNYSQLLPKFFTKDNVLDYYFPEFGHIGNQPIPYREVTPLQSYAAGDPLTDTFGYQRAWYDYLASVDEVHGDFRLSLDGFLINRVFQERPELGKEFIQCDESQMSSPFSVVGDFDKILGQIYFEVTAKRPIPKYGIPRIE